MSLGFLTGYVLGQRDASQSALRAAAIPSVSGASTENILDVDERVDRLLLVVAAMWSLLEDTGMTEERLEARMRDLDEADGAADGKLTAPTVTCADCGAAVLGELSTCQFCGTAVPGHDSDPFTSI